MKATGRVWLFGDDINTDLILPHKALRLSPKEQCRLCMSDNRPGWADQVKEGDFLIAGKNFGTGSSRPGAAVLKNLGLAGLIAESYNGLFYRNCICYGFAAVAAPGTRKAILPRSITAQARSAISAPGKACLPSPWPRSCWISFPPEASKAC